MSDEEEDSYGEIDDIDESHDDDSLASSYDAEVAMHNSCHNVNNPVVI